MCNVGVVNNITQRDVNNINQLSSITKDLYELSKEEEKSGLLFGCHITDEGDINYS